MCVHNLLIYIALFKTSGYFAHPKNDIRSVGKSYILIKIIIIDKYLIVVINKGMIFIL